MSKDIIEFCTDKLGITVESSNFEKLYDENTITSNDTEMHLLNVLTEYFNHTDNISKLPLTAHALDQCYLRCLYTIDDVKKHMNLLDTKTQDEFTRFGLAV